MDAAAIRWLLVTAGVVVLWLAWREVTAYLCGYSAIRRGQLFLRLTINLLFLVALLSIEIEVYWLLPFSCLGGVALLALADTYISKRRLRKEAKGLGKFFHSS